MSPGRKFFLHPDRCGHWRFQAIVVSGSWELTLRNRVGLLGGAERVHSGEESRMFPPRSAYKYPGSGAQSEERTQQKVCYRAEDEPGRLSSRGEE